MTSTLDRAFLKAHQKTHAPQRPIAFVAVQATAPAASVPELEQTIENDSAAPASAVRAAYEVPCLDWPEICRRLVAAADKGFELLVADVLEQARRGAKTLVVTSGRRGEGRTTFALCLAKVLAEKGARLALVDGDFQQPQLAARLDLVPQAGWDDVLAGRLGLEEALIESLADQVTVLPLREATNANQSGACEWNVAGNSSPAGPAEPGRTSGEIAEIAKTFAALENSFDLVIVIGSPAQDAGDLALLGKCVRGSSQPVYVVRDVRAAGCRERTGLDRSLARAGITRWQVADNFVPAAEHAEE